MTIRTPARTNSHNLWGWILLAAYIVATLLSWWAMPPSLTRTIVRVILLASLSGTSILWMRAIGNARSTPDLMPGVRRLVVAIAACGIVATPMLTRDAWCYAAFARLAASGVDPYLVELPETLLAEFGSPFCGGTPTYGPIWVYGSAVIDRVVSAFGPFAEVLALRVVMTLAWVAMVLGAVTLLRSREPAGRAAGLVAMSVVPISLFELVSEAHNDVVMMAFVVYWLVLRSKGSWLSPLPLTVSVLVKYVTAPLLVLAAIEAWRRGRRRETAVAVGCLLTLVLLAAIFWRDGALLASLTKNNANWRWLSAPFAIELLVKNIGPFTWVAPAVLAWRLLLAAVVAWYVQDWFRSPPSDSRLYRLVAVGALALLFASEYLWPWYLIWALPFVVLADDRIVSAVAWPFFAIMPVAQVAWAGGRRELGYRTEVILLFVGAMVAVWLLQAWLALRARRSTLVRSSA